VRTVTLRSGGALQGIRHQAVEGRRIKETEGIDKL